MRMYVYIYTYTNAIYIHTHTCMYALLLHKRALSAGSNFLSAVLTIFNDFSLKMPSLASAFFFRMLTYCNRPRLPSQHTCMCQYLRRYMYPNRRWKTTEDTLRRIATSFSAVPTGKPAPPQEKVTDRHTRHAGAHDCECVSEHVAFHDRACSPVCDPGYRRAPCVFICILFTSCM
jgi:hypothetical protein